MCQNTEKFSATMYCSVMARLASSLIALEKVSIPSPIQNLSELLLRASRQKKFYFIYLFIYLFS
uniref:Uncharacterized protein n=1 Tax=Anguilla anguilla TaxID=7936 RepID=A0A0E9X2S5_ANGAN